MLSTNFLEYSSDFFRVTATISLPYLSFIQNQSDLNTVENNVSLIDFAIFFLNYFVSNQLAGVVSFKSYVSEQLFVL